MQLTPELAAVRAGLEAPWHDTFDQVVAQLEARASATIDIPIDLSGYSQLKPGSN